MRRLSIFVLYVTCAFGSLSSEPVHPINKDSSPTVKENRTEEQVQHQTPEIIRSAHSPAKRASDNKESQHQQETNRGPYIVEVRSLPETRPDWWFRAYVGLTALTAIVGIGTLCFVWRQSSVMKKQFGAFLETQRPQLAADPHGNPAKDFCDPAGPRVQIEIHNVGLTTAYDCTYESWIEILQPPFVDFTSAADHFGSSNRFSLHSRHKPTVINIPLRQGITPQQVRSVHQGELDVCVRVKVVYRDAFTPNRYANFGYMVDATGFRFLPKYLDSN